jgi:hypothetical protein
VGQRSHWREIEKSPGRYDFRTLDAIVRQANAKGAQTLIVLGMTPSFYASKRTGTEFYGSGSASMPKNLNAWKRYVSAVANRPGVKGNPRVQFQVWNEANVVGFWNGTPGQLAQLTKLTREALGSGRYLLAPAFVSRNSAQRTWIDRFYSTRVGGRRVADYVNAVSLQLYPLPTGTPEASMAILALDRKILAKYGVRKPIWNTEVNYGLTGRPTAPREHQPAGGQRVPHLLLNAPPGIQRVFWYAWGPIRSRTPARPPTTAPSPWLGKAFGVTRSWLVNSRIRGCTRNSVGTYTCTITYSGGVRGCSGTRAGSSRPRWQAPQPTSSSTARCAATPLARCASRSAIAPVMIRSAR